MLDKIVKGVIDVLNLTTEEVARAREAVKRALASNEARPWERAKLEHPGMVTTPLEEAFRRQQAVVYKLRGRANVELPKALELAIAYDIAREDLEAIQLNLSTKQANDAEKQRKARQQTSFSAEEVPQDGNVVPLRTPDMSAAAEAALKGQSPLHDEPAGISPTLTNEAFEEFAQAVIDPTSVGAGTGARAKPSVTPAEAALIAGEVLRLDMTERQYWPAEGVDQGDYDQTKLVQALNSSLDKRTAKMGTAKFLVAAREGRAREFIHECHKAHEEEFVRSLLDGEAFAIAAARKSGFNV